MRRTLGHDGRGDAPLGRRRVDAPELDAAKPRRGTTRAVREPTLHGSVLVTDESWDAVARPAGWLEPDEQVLWRGNPDHRLRLDRRGILAIAATVAALGYL